MLFGNPLGLSDQQLALLASAGRALDLSDPRGGQLNLAPETRRPGLDLLRGLSGSSNAGSGTTVLTDADLAAASAAAGDPIAPSGGLFGGGNTLGGTIGNSVAKGSPGESSFFERFFSEGTLGSALGSGLFGAEQFNMRKEARAKAVGRQSELDELVVREQRAKVKALENPSRTIVEDASGRKRFLDGGFVFPGAEKPATPPAIVKLQQARDVARAEGRFKDADQITGQIDSLAASETFDLRNKTPVTDQPAETSSTRFADIINPGGATGLAGAVKGLINSISDGFGFGLAFKDANKASVALQSLRNGTLLALTATGIEGRPSVFSSEKVDALTIKPGEVFSGPGASAAKAQRLFTDIDTEIKRMDRDILANPGSFTKQAISKARANRSQLVGLRDAYAEIIRLFEGGGGPKQPITDLNEFFRNK